MGTTSPIFLIIMKEKTEQIIINFKGKMARLSIETIIISSIFMIAFLAFTVIAQLVFISEKASWDYTIFLFLKNNISRQNTEIMKAFSFLGSHYFLIPGILFLTILFLFQNLKWYSIKIPAISISSLFIMLASKYFFNRPRPLYPLIADVNGLSFPSGHALMSISFYGLLMYLTLKKITNAWLKVIILAVLFITIFFIGVSRVYLRVHYVTDVLAGYCLGMAWLSASLIILKRIEQRHFSHSNGLSPR